MTTDDLMWSFLGGLCIGLLLSSLERSIAGLQRRWWE